VWKLVPGALSWAPLRGRLETRWERISPALPRYIGGPPLLRHPGRAPVVPLLQRPCRDPGKEGLRAGRGIVGRRRAGRESRPSGRGSDRKTRGERKEVGMLNTAAAFFFVLPMAQVFNLARSTVVCGRSGAPARWLVAMACPRSAGARSRVRGECRRQAQPRRPHSPPSPRVGVSHVSKHTH
jgi:hypothetical protein